MTQLRIEPVGRVGAFRVLLDGHDVSRSCTRLLLDMEAGAPATAEISVFVDEVIVDAEVLATFERIELTERQRERP
ncbi:MAG: hypothetical protein E6Q97_23290 [Desulfurellales bacterium]|nr:MAG: hypothetical protein E6Q97_23290 [Desulfurellales bacterium]